MKRVFFIGSGAARRRLAETDFPLTVGGSEQATDLFSFFDDIIDRLLSAQG